MKIHKKINKKSIKNILYFKFIKNNIFLKKILEMLKLLKIVLKFYLFDRKLLFIGSPKKLSFFFKFIINLKNITFLTNTLISKGLFSNLFVFKSLLFLNKKKSLSKFILNFSKNYDLIICFNYFNHYVDSKNAIFFLINSHFDYLNDIIPVKCHIIKNETFYFYLIYQILLKFKQ